MRSTPPSSSNFALMPVPAPAPMMGRCESMLFRSLRSTSLRVSAILFSCCLCPGVRYQVEHHAAGLFGELSVVDICVELHVGNVRVEVVLQCVEHDAVCFPVAKQ